MNLASPSRLIRTALTLLMVLSLLLGTTTATAQNRPQKDPLLTEDDIALFKVYEVNLEADPPPRVIIPREKALEFVKEFQAVDPDLRGKTNQDKFVRSEGHIQLGKFFEHKARDYYKHVRIRSQIQSLRDWGNTHRRYILGYFQPTFGAGAVEGLYLFGRGRDTERIEMTNLYILTQVAIDGKPLIDRNEPEDSLLVQWGLPREEAKFPAPNGIAGWEPKFKDMKDKRFIEQVDWIKSLIPANQGSSYGIDYTMPEHKKPQN